MRIFGFSIIRAAAMDRVHALSKERMSLVEHLTADCKSYQRQISQLEEGIEALRAKCSLVNLSALQNRIEELEDWQKKAVVLMAREVVERMFEEGDVTDENITMPNGKLSKQESASDIDVLGTLEIVTPVYKSECERRLQSWRLAGSVQTGADDK